MSDIELRESEELVLPVTGEVIDLNDEVACAVAMDDLSVMLGRIYDARRALGAAIAERARILGTKSITLPGGRKAVVTGGPEKQYDAEAIERELRAAGLPEERVRQVVREEITHTVRAVEAKRVAGANEEYAEIIERNTTEITKPYSVTIRRT